MDFIKRLYSYFNNKFLFDKEKSHPSIREQKEYLNSFPKPNDEYDLSFYKYKCVCYYYYSIMNILFLNSISFFAIPILYIIIRFKGLFKDHLMEQFIPNNLILCNQSKVVPNDDVFPEELRNKYLHVQEYSRGYADIYLLKHAQIIFFCAFRKHPICFHYLLVLLIRLSQQSYLISTFRPKCITTYVCEREFSDPLLTKFCEFYGVNYIGHMHGEDGYSIVSSFMHLTQYWVWSEHYRELFQSLRSDVDMPIYCPKKHTPLVKARPNESDYDYFCTYYLTTENSQTIYIIRDIFDEFKMIGKRCLVRPHPRFSNIDFIKEVFKSEMIENPLEVSIEISLDRSYLAISTISSVMASAYYSGKKVIIDDVTDPRLYKKAVEAQHSCVGYACMRLSDLITRLNDKSNGVI